jgi:hypothetical protein
MSGEARHTPGPWHLRPVRPAHSTRTVRDEQGSEIAFLQPDYVSFADADERTEANARLIAAAPEILEALKAMLAPYEGTSETVISKGYGLSTMLLVRGARAAVSKAEAKQ